MSDDQASKTEEPSGQRLGEARGKGQVAQSREISHLIMITAMLIVLLMIGPLMSRDLMGMLRRFIELPHQIRVDDGNFHALIVDTTGQIAGTLVLPLLLLMIASATPGLLQHGWLWTTHPLKPQLSRISPFTGIGRLFSIRSVIELVKGLVKIAIVGFVAMSILSPVFGYVEQFITADLALLMPAMLALTVKLLAGVIVVLLAMAVGDYFYQKYEMMKSLRMTKQELKDEFKQQEGDPTIKQKLRRIRAARSRARMMAAVPSATVVVTNPTHYAVALKYEQGMNGAGAGRQGRRDRGAAHHRQGAREFHPGGREPAARAHHLRRGRGRRRDPARALQGGRRGRRLHHADAQERDPLSARRREALSSAAPRVAVIGRTAKL
ncbi:MAG: EscU/YscU/HrcU family type III secretion system export apparatus switch protein [Pseudomonadota bacterium]